MTQGGSVCIPSAVVDMLMVADEQDAARALLLFVRLVRTGRMPSVQDESSSTRMILSAAVDADARAARRREQNRRAWDAYKERNPESWRRLSPACQSLPSACQAKEGKKESAPPPIPPTTIKKEGKKAPLQSPREASACQAKEGADGSSPSPAEARLAAAVEKAFASFWQMYPRKVGKPMAFKAFNAVYREARASERNALYLKMMSALRAAKGTRGWTKDGGEFIPHPTTWLHQRRWEDEGVVLDGDGPDRTRMAAADSLAERLMADLRKGGAA